MVLKQVKYSFLRLLGILLLGNVVTLLCRTLKVERVNAERFDELVNKGQNFILAFWHGTMLYPWFWHRNRKYLGLISLSKDGEILARILSKWNYTVLRGSSSRGGDVALGIMIDFARHEGSVALTPDGPRGPARQFKAGAVIAAKKSGAPLVLVGVGYEKSRRLHSWDSFAVPKPFSRVKMVYSDPIYIEKSLLYEEVSEIIADAEIKLNSLQKEAEVFTL